MHKVYLIIFVFAFVTQPVLGQSVHTDKLSVQTAEDLYIIHAKLTDKSTGKGIAGQRAFVSIPGPGFEMRTTMSDSAGNLRFLMKGIEGRAQLIFQYNSTENGNYNFEFGDSFATRSPLEKYTGADRPLRDMLPFYGKADKEYYLDDYTRFPTMEEVLIEYVAEVRVRKTRKQFNLSVLNTPFNIYFDDDPLILIDGVPVFDLNLLMALDPLKIKKIDVVARKYYFGSLRCSGIISFFSYEGDLAGYTLPRQAEVRDIDQSKLK